MKEFIFVHLLLKAIQDVGEVRILLSKLLDNLRLVQREFLHCLSFLDIPQFCRFTVSLCFARLFFFEFVFQFLKLLICSHQLSLIASLLVGKLLLVSSFELINLLLVELILLNNLLSSLFKFFHQLFILYFLIHPLWLKVFIRIFIRFETWLQLLYELVFALLLCKDDLNLGFELNLRSNTLGLLLLLGLVHPLSDHLDPGLCWLV